MLWSSQWSKIHTTRPALHCAPLPAAAAKLRHPPPPDAIPLWVDEPDQLPEGYQAEIPSEGLPRTVADYIAGMTDSYILLQYAEVRRNIRAGRRRPVLPTSL